jgi:hypothetical protein
MTHLSSTSVALGLISTSLLNKAWRVYHFRNHFPSIVKYAGVLDPTQVHIQITISRYSYIDHSHEFVGSALARFERSTLPDHKGTRTIVLRFLKIITPVKCVLPLYDGYICCPEEGELYRKFAESAVWSVNIDKSEGGLLRALQLLWDA